MSTDQPAAISFYKELLGWTTEVQEMGTGPYTMFSSSKKQLGGTVPLDSSLGMPSHWVSYITVDDLDATCAQIEQLGGTIHQPPFAVPSVGRMAVAADPGGAIFSPFQEEDVDYTPKLPNGVQPGGAVAWHELSTGDQNRADDFYAAIFGWGKVVWPMDDGEYHGLTVGETPVAGVFRKLDDVPSAWTIYFEAPGTIGEAAANVTRLGGSLVREPFTVEGTGDILIAADPSGAVFGMMKSTPMP